MEKKKWEFHTVVMRLAAVLLSLVLISSGIVSGRYARYVTSATGHDSARVAKFSVTQSILDKEEYDLTVTIPMPDIRPGETVPVTVKIDHDTEVAVRNTITVENLYSNLPLTFRIAETGTTGSDGSTLAVEYGPGTFEKEYVISVTWVSDGNDLNYIGMVDLLTITVTTEQVD